MAGLEDIYRSLEPAKRAAHVLGQIFWIPAYIHMPDYYVLRMGSWDRTSPVTLANFTVEKRHVGRLTGSADLYAHMPIPELKLKSDEEIIVKKVKLRPAVLIVRDGIDPRHVAGTVGASRRSRNPNSHVFAPIVSLRKEGNTTTDYSAKFIEQVAAGQLPEFIHLPPDGRTLKNESMAVLTHLQSHGASFVEETECALQPLYLATALEMFWQDAEGTLLEMAESGTA
jgi:hypothetical protein